MEWRVHASHCNPRGLTHFRKYLGKDRNCQKIEAKIFFLQGDNLQFSCKSSIKFELKIPSKLNSYDSNLN